MIYKALSKSSFLMRAAFFILMLFSATTLSNAQTVTFGQFYQVAGSNDFVFTNNFGLSGTFEGSSAVTFIYHNVSGLPPELQGPQSATVYVTGSTTTPAFTDGDRVNQPFNQTFTIQIIRHTPASTGGGSRTNLLTAVVTPASSLSDLAGEMGANSAAYTASTPNQMVDYTSDFINFNAPVVSRNLALAFSSVTPILSLGPGNFLNSFSAAGTGTFAANPGPLFFPLTAASVKVSGRVFGAKGVGLARAQVTLTNSAGETFTTQTNSLGYYQFLDVEAGQSVVLSVSAKRYTFAPKVVNIGGDLDGVDFSPQ